MAVTSALVDNTFRVGSSGTTSTITGVQFGSAFAGRVLVDAYISDTISPISSGTIAGVSAVDTDAGGAGLGLLSAVVASGTSGNVVGTFGASDVLNSVGAIALTGAASATPTDTISVLGTGGTIDVPAGGCIVAIAYASGGAGSWTGATEVTLYDTGGGPIISVATFDNAGGALSGRSVSYSTADAVAVAAFDADAGGAQNLDPSLFTNTNTFYAPTVVGPRELTPSLFTNSNSFFAPTVVNRGDLLGTLQVNANSITTSFAATGSVAVSVGDLVVSVVCQQTNLTVTGVTDNLGNTYTAQNAGTDAGAVTGRAFYSIVTTGGALTSVTAACTGSTNDGVHIVAAFKGVFSAIDKNIANITSDVTSPFTCPSTGTLTQADEIVISWGVANHGTSWSTSSPSLQAIQLANSTTIKAAINYRVVAATSAISPAFTAGSNPTQAVLGTFTFSMATSATQNLTPSLFTNSQSFYGPTITTGAVDLAPSLVTNNQTFYGPTVVNLNTVTPSLVTNGQTFYAATVTAGEVTLTPSLFTNTQSFFGPTVAAGEVTLSPSLYTNTQTFYGPVVSLGGVTLEPALFTNTQTFYGPTVAAGAVELLPDLFTNDQTFFGPTITGGGTVALLPSLVVNDQVFFGPTVSQESVPEPVVFRGGGSGLSAEELRRLKKKEEERERKRRKFEKDLTETLREAYEDSVHPEVKIERLRAQAEDDDELALITMVLEHFRKEAHERV